MERKCAVDAINKLGIEIWHNEDKGKKMVKRKDVEVAMT